jgi:hypothetical protein
MHANEESLQIPYFQDVGGHSNVIKPGPVAIADVNARERVRRAVERRLGELHMTGRAFGKTFSANHGKGHGDQWVSNLLKGRFGLSLEELDEAARALRTTPSDLVRHPDDQSWIIPPHEMRLLRATRTLPPAIRDHMIVLAEYLIGVAPDEVEMLTEYRCLSPEEQQRIRHWTHVLRLSAEPEPRRVVPADPGEIEGPPRAPTQSTRGRKQ